MKKIIRCLSISFGLIAALCAVSVNDAQAARVRLTPEHLYRWAHENNTTRLTQFKRYINLMDQNKNTALCLAQKAKDKKAYSLLLDYGASTKAPCHDDNDPICAIIAGEKTKLHPAGWALLAAGAAAGAYLLLDDDDKNKCDISQYPLPECPPHGICSECEDKKKLEDCEEGWTPNHDKTQCVPVPCPEDETPGACPQKLGHVTESIETGHISGDEKCYICNYKCDTAGGFYDTDDACRTQYAGYTCIPQHGCFIKGFCDITQGNYGTIEDCEAANRGYTCAPSGVDGSCWTKSIAKTCTIPAVETGKCTQPATGIILTETPNGEYAGENMCVNCSYACDTNLGWTDTCPAGKVCTTVTTPDGKVCNSNPQCPTGQSYPSQAACEAANLGYVCVETAPGSGCWGKDGTTPKACITPYSTAYQSAADCGAQGENGWIWEQDTTVPFSGTLKCGKCTAKLCPTGTSTDYKNSTNCPQFSNLTASSSGQSSYNGNDQCYKCNYTCNGTNAYSSEAVCTNGGFTCTPETQNGIICYKRTGSENCPTDYPNSTPCVKDNTKYVTTETSTTVGFDTCYKCVYACKTNETTCPAGKTCTEVTTPDGLTCYQNPQCPSGYTYTSKTQCETANPGYYCEESATGSGCWRKDNDNIKQCTPPAVKQGSCTAADSYHTLTETENGEQSGDTPCVTCTYGCKTGTYTSQSACTTGGYTCTEHTQSGVSCWERTGSVGCPTGYTAGLNNCNNEAHPEGWTYSSSGTSGGQTCGKCTAKTCPAPSSTDYSNANNCAKYSYLQASSIGTNDYAGNTRCYNCSYQCNGSSAFTSESACLAENVGYTCTQQTQNGITCWIQGGASACPNGYSTSYPNLNSCGTSGSKGWTWTSSGTSGGQTCGKCTAKTCVAPAVQSCAAADNYHTVTSTNSSTSYIGDTPCVTCTYGCKTGTYTSQSACTTGGYTCTEHTQSGVSCWERTGSVGCPTGYTAGLNNCNNEAHPEGWTYSSSGTSGGQTCGKCTAKTCPAPSSTDYSNANNCAKYSYLQASSIGTNDYAGNTRCYNCSYQCNGTDSFTSQILCEQEYSICTLRTSENGMQCYVGSGTKLSILPNNLTHNTTTLSLSSTGNDDIIGLSGSETLENSVNKTTGEQGVIDITHNSTGTAYGMRGLADNRLINHDGAAIRIQNNAGGTAYGMYAAAGGTAYNRGEIKIGGQSGIAYGIFGEGQNSIDNSGTIDVSGRDAYGIYVKDGQGTDIFNSGTININASNEAHGIYVEKNGTDAVITNTGTIIVNNEEKSGNTGITLNGAKLKNASVMRFSRAADFNTLGGKVYLEKGGVYEAESISGDLNAGTSTVLGGNKDTYTAESALKTEDISGLNIASESAMFNAKVEKNQSGNGYNVTQERKNFAEFAPNSSIAEYLEQNYKEGFLEGMFDKFKQYGDANSLSAKAAKDLGYDILPNFADENYTVIKSLNRNIANTLLKPTDEENRVVAGYDNINWETDGKGFLSGSDMHANSMYTFGDKRLDNQNRLGLGLSFTKLSSSYDTGGDRDLNIASIFVPYVHKFTDNLRLATVASVGYGYGEYDRGSNRDSDISAIFYSITNELRYTIDLNGFAELEPALMLNAIGYSEDNYDEGNAEGAIETQNHNTHSLEAGFGLFLKKSVQTEKYGKFGFKVGGIYYRELGSPYKSIDARVKNGNNLWYRVNDYANLYSHDRAIIEAAIDYEYKQIGVYLKYNRLIQKNNPELFDLGVKYNF